jgi:hypothetical protein
MMSLRRWPEAAVGLVLLCAVVWLRWPTFGFNYWNVDEAIHAAAARTLLDGGVLYRDAIDQRTPLSYHAVAAVMAVFGTDNFRAVRGGIALLIAATAFLLFLAGRRLRGPAAGLGAAGLYALLSSSLLYPGDAYAANTEWFVAFFSTAAAVVFLTVTNPPGSRRLVTTGVLLGCSFLSKQPALLDLAAPAAALVYTGWRQAWPRRTRLTRLLAIGAGWCIPVLLTLGYFAARGALRECVFCTWTYNLAYYGPEITAAGRLEALATPFRLMGAAQPWLLGAWAAGAVLALHRLVQRQPSPQTNATNPGFVFLAVWSLAALAGVASSGRGFEHYSIQFLAPLCLGGGLVLARLLSETTGSGLSPFRRLGAAALLALVIFGLAAAVMPARQRTLPVDPSIRVATYIRDHSAPADRIFVWGFHPDIYGFADRRPASRYLFASFVTGLIPWTNTAPERDTTYAIVPGAMEHLLQDLAARPPLFIVDCSAGPYNRHWQKYPLEKFPALHDFIRDRYRSVKGGEFVPQGFRLFQLRGRGDVADDHPENRELPAGIASTLRLGPLAPLRASAPFGADRTLADGRLEYFMHAPATLVYRIPAGYGALRGGFGFRPAAYGPENQSPTDGAEFVIRWRPVAGSERILLRRLLRPHDEPSDRSLQSFHVILSAAAGGELELAISPGPTDNPASDWTFWTDLLLEKNP